MSRRHAAATACPQSWPGCAWGRCWEWAAMGEVRACGLLWLGSGRSGRAHGSRAGRRLAARPACCACLSAPQIAHPDHPSTAPPALPAVYREVWRPGPTDTLRAVAVKVVDCRWGSPAAAAALREAALSRGFEHPHVVKASRSAAPAGCAAPPAAPASCAARQSCNASCSLMLPGCHHCGTSSPSQPSPPVTV